MVNWTDEALILGGRRFGEGGLILDVLTKMRGRRSGLVYGGASRRRRAQLEAGNTVEVSWSGRLEEQLGRFDVAEATTERASRLMDDADALAGVSAITTILRSVIDEGDAAGSALYDASTIVLDALDTPELWPALYVRWEMGLLSALGYGLEISTCAISGANDGLTHVSPKSGRAVKGSEAEDYVDRLLRLPGFLLDSGSIVSPSEIGDGLILTGHFLERRIYYAVNKPPPEQRDLLLRRLERSGLIELRD